MGFDVTPTVTADWTNNLDALETGINRLRPGGGTALFDAVYTACRDKLLSERGQEPVRKAMVLISDGDDNQSRVRPDEAIKMCQRAETIIYAISTNWTPSRGKGDQVLEQMSTATGGRVFFPPSVEEMANSFHEIQAELRSQYSLIYTPADFKANGAFRPIYLFCNDRRYQVRAGRATRAHAITAVLSMNGRFRPVRSLAYLSPRLRESAFLRCRSRFGTVEPASSCFRPAPDSFVAARENSLHFAMK